MGIEMEIDNLHVNMRQGFSDRNNLITVHKTLQYDDLDNRTRIELLNETNEIFDSFFGSSGLGWEPNRQRISREEFGYYLLKDVFCIPYSNAKELSKQDGWEIVIKNVILKHPYFEVFDLLEYLARETQDIVQNQIPFNKIMTPEDIYNEVFKKEYVGYRFIKGEIIKITDENEIKEVLEAASSPYAEVNLHLEKAKERLSDRENPDYENSIKESISSIEAICVLLLGEKGELGALLKKLEDKGIRIHPALKGAFQKLYGYTSDAKGIRHAGDIGGENATFEEAKFMLVACSAFVNYLKEVSIKTK